MFVQGQALPAVEDVKSHVTFSVTDFGDKSSVYKSGGLVVATVILQGNFTANSSLKIFSIDSSLRYKASDVIADAKMINWGTGLITGEGRIFSANGTDFYAIPSISSNSNVLQAQIIWAV